MNHAANPRSTSASAAHGLDCPIPPSAPATLPLDRRGRLKNGNPSGDFLAAPRCGARSRGGGSCRGPAMANGRCRMHGGASTGPRTPEGLARSRRARYRHGFRSAEITAFRQEARAAIRRLDMLTALVRTRRPAAHGLHRRISISASAVPAPAPSPCPPARGPEGATRRRLLASSGLNPCGIPAPSAAAAYGVDRCVSPLAADRALDGIAAAAPAAHGVDRSFSLLALDGILPASSAAPLTPAPLHRRHPRV